MVQFYYDRDGESIMKLHFPQTQMNPMKRMDVDYHHTFEENERRGFLFSPFLGYFRESYHKDFKTIVKDKGRSFSVVLRHVFY